MTTTIKINCGCGKIFTNSTGLGTLADAIKYAQTHAMESGHTLEIMGTIQPGGEVIHTAPAVRIPLGWRER